MNSGSVTISTRDVQQDSHANSLDFNRRKVEQMQYSATHYGLHPFESVRTLIPGCFRSGLTALLLSLALTSGCGDSKTMSAEEEAAYEELKAFGALVVRDGVHPATVTLPSGAPQISENLDKVIECVGKLPYLAHLELTDLDATDDHMKTVSKLRRINSLVLSGTHVGDEGLKSVSSLPLNTLYIDNSQATGAAMSTLGKISDLEILEISGLDVTDISPLKSLKELEWLIINDTAIGTEAIDVICEMPELRRLSVKGAEISTEDLLKLKKAKPSLQLDGPGELEEDAADDTSEPEVVE